MRTPCKPAHPYTLPCAHTTPCTRPHIRTPAHPCAHTRTSARTHPTPARRLMGDKFSVYAPPSFFPHHSLQPVRPHLQNATPCMCARLLPTLPPAARTLEPSLKVCALCRGVAYRMACCGGSHAHAAMCAARAHFCVAADAVTRGNAQSAGQPARVRAHGARRRHPPTGTHTVLLHTMLRGLTHCADPV
ncbi:hypothetical protein EON67_00545 [archaeon]|nr:MAG: hypothetical protein EON67_00545 [archaeon]